MTQQPHLELSRPYFQREARFGRRVIFQWTPADRWPGPCATGAHPGPEDWCPICRERPYVEGFVFRDEAAAMAFDLEAMVAEVDEESALFDSWDDAQRWLLARSAP